MDDSLFGDIVATVTAEPTVVRGRSGIGDQAREAWELWCAITGRHDADRMDNRFYKTYVDLLKRNYPHAELLQSVKGAARLDPRPNDPKDIRRVLMPLTNMKHDRVALKALRDGLPVIPFPEDDDTEPESSISDLEIATNVPRRDWTDLDLEAAGVLIQQLNPVQLKDVADAVALYISSERVLPTDMLRHHRTAATGDLGSRSRASRDSYSAGRTEAATVQEVRFVADPAAERKYLKGTMSAEQVVAFHNLAPQGYWDRVIEELDRNTSTEVKAVYTELAAEFDGWNPSHRNTPNS